MVDSVVLGTVVTVSEILTSGWVAIVGGRIAGVGEGPPPNAGTVIDHSGGVIMPGLVDGHVHTSSASGWVGIESATRQAAAGGVTTCVDMPYDVPHAVTNAAVLADKIAWVDRTAHVDVALYGTVRKSGGIAEIQGMAAGGVSAFKLSTYEYENVRFPRIDHPTMIDAFSEFARVGIPVSVHNEDQELVEHLIAKLRATGRGDPIAHALTRPPLAEALADNEIFEIGLHTGAHVHIAHSSIARGFEIADGFRRVGAKATSETCVHYLCMTEDDLIRLGGRGKCNPPFRSAEEVERLWMMLLSDKIHYISTDHAPWPVARKQEPNIFDNGAGLVGLQTFATLMYSILQDRGLPLTLMATYCADRPARHHGLTRKGRIETGFDADLVVLEPGRFVFDEASIQDRAEVCWSPYHNRTMRARVAATYLRGQLIWDGSSVLSTPGTGAFVRRGTPRKFG